MDFARALGGIVSDKAGVRWGLRGKGVFLAAVLLLEGIGLIVFATYGITPFINEKNTGLVSGIVGAGGNLGSMIFGFLFKSEGIS